MGDWTKDGEEPADATYNVAQDQEQDVDHEIDAAAKLSGATIEVTEDSEGVFLVNQIVPPQAPPSKGRGDHSISWSFGPFTVTGTVNTDTLSISVNITILGINLGGFHGNLRDGLSIKVNLVAVKGEVKFYLKNGNEVWVYLALKVLFDGNYDTEQKLITL